MPKFNIAYLLNFLASRAPTDRQKSRSYTKRGPGRMPFNRRVRS